MPAPNRTSGLEPGTLPVTPENDAIALESGLVKLELPDGSVVYRWPPDAKEAAQHPGVTILAWPRSI
jgi:hypothetical protein